MFVIQAGKYFNPPGGKNISMSNLKHGSSGVTRRNVAACVYEYLISYGIPHVLKVRIKHN